MHIAQTASINLSYCPIFVFTYSLMVKLCTERVIKSACYVLFLKSQERKDVEIKCLTLSGKKQALLLLELSS